MSSLRIPTAEVFEPLLQPARYKGAHGGRGSGKSYFFAGLALEESITKPLDVVCIREIQRTLDQSVKKLLETQIAEHNLRRAFGWMGQGYEACGVASGLHRHPRMALDKREAQGRMNEVTSSAHLQKAEQALRMAWLVLIDGKDDAASRRYMLEVARHAILYAQWKGKL